MKFVTNRMAMCAPTLGFTLVLILAIGTGLNMSWCDRGGRRQVAGRADQTVPGNLGIVRRRP